MSIIYLFGCSNIETNIDHSNTIAFDNITYIEKFPKKVYLTEGEDINLDIVGVKEIYTIDSMLVVRTQEKNGAWSFYSINNHRLLGSFINIGKANNEFIFAPLLGTQSYYVDKNSDHICILHKFANSTLKFNISQSLRDNKLAIEVMSKISRPNVFSYQYINDSTYYMRHLSNDERYQNREFVVSGESYIPDHIKLLNKSKVGERCDFNIISSISQYNHHNNILIEAPISLNTLNLYNVNGTFSKTICLGKELMSISKCESRPIEKMLYTFEKVRHYDTFFSVLYLGITRLEYEERQTRPLSESTIYVFDYKGEPLCEICVGYDIESYCFSQNGQHIYILNKAEEIYRYNIKF